MTPQLRPRLRDLGVSIGRLPCGPQNALSDVAGVRVGHVTLIRGEGKLAPGEGPVRTGVTAIIPDDGILPCRPLPAAVDVINGYGKSVGLVQVQELGEIETPILLTNTLNVGKAMDALVQWMVRRDPNIRSVNAVVMECNDSSLNDIQGRHVKREHVFEALANASAEFDEGSVGAGTGMRGFGFKAGIGTASRVLDAADGGWTVGALSLTNTGGPGDLRIDGVAIPAECAEPESEFGSIILIVATDAPTTSWQLKRLVRRASFGLARAGGIASHGSGDIALAFSTLPAETAAPVSTGQLSTLFRACLEAVEEAIVNSVLASGTMVGRDGNRAAGIDCGKVRELVRVRDG